MKKRKILVLFPLLGLLLSGCTFQEGYTTTKNWISDHIIQPIKNLFNKNKSSGGGSDSGKDSGKDSGDDSGKTDPGTAEHAGTMSDPFTGADANAIAAALDDGAYSSTAYYVKGVVQEAAFGGDNFGNFDITIEDGFIGYRMKNGETKASFHDGDIIQGDIVLMYGKIKNYKGTYELDGTQAGGAYVVSVERPAPTDAELTSISIGGTAKTEYSAGESYSHAGLTVTAHYSDNASQDVTSFVSWSYSKATAAVGDDSVIITAEYKGKSDSLNVSVKVAAPHAGTEDDPLTGGDANVIAAALPSGSYSTDSYYVQGVVQSIDEAFNPQFGNYSFSIEDGFKGYRMKKANNTAFNEGDVAVGYIVKMYGRIKNYNGTYELDGTANGGAYVVSVTTEIVDVASVTLAQGEDTLNLELGKAGANLHATVLPENATNKAVQWSSDNEAIATVTQEGYVEPKGVGDTYIRVASQADSSKEAVCHVYVTESQATVTSIVISGSPNKTSYTVGEDFDPTGLVVTAHYSDNDEQNITSLVVANWTASPNQAALGITSVTFSVTYEQHSDSIEVVVSVSEAKGTVDHPYTVAEARAAIDKGEGLTDVYATGIVSEIVTPFSSQYNNISFNISADGSKTGDQLQGFRTTVSSADDVAVGDTVVLFGTLKKFNSTYEFDAGNTIYSRVVPTVSSVIISGTPSQTTYGVGQAYSHDGLIATATLSNGAEIDVSGEATWTPSKVNAEAGDQSVSFTASYGGETSPSFSFGITISDVPVEVETEIYKLDGTTTGGSSGYAEASSITQGTLSWSVVANTTMNPWRFGGKGAQVRNCESTTAVSTDDVTKVVVTTGTATCTVNSVTLKVGTSQGSGDISEISITSGLTSATLEFARPANTSWASRYFTIVFDVTCASGSNQYVQFKSAQFYAMK